MSCVIHKFRMVHLLATPVQSASAFWWWCWVPVSMRHLKRSETPNRWRSGPVYENKPFREHYPERTGDGRGPRGGRSGLYTLTLTLTAQFFNEVIVANGSSHRTWGRLPFFQHGTLLPSAALPDGNLIADDDCWQWWWWTTNGARGSEIPPNTVLKACNNVKMSPRANRERNNSGVQGLLVHFHFAKMATREAEV